MYTRASQPPISSSHPSSVLPRLFWLPAFFILTASLLWIGKTNAQNAAAHQAQANEQPPQTLEAGKPIERELAGGQSHSYQLTLQPGQYVKVVVEQKGIDVIVRLLNTNGKQLSEINKQRWTRDAEVIDVLSDAADIYLLKIWAIEKDPSPGKYEIRLEELRAATEKDRALVESERMRRDSAALTRRSQFDQALPLAAQSLKIREEMLDSQHPHVAESLDNLALLYHTKGDYRSAEPLFRRAVVIFEKALGPGHPDLAWSVRNLAFLYKDKGDFDTAEQLYRRATAIFEETLGPEHRDLALPLIDLADLYRDKADYTAAEPLYRRALAIRERGLNPEHPDLATSLIGLASLYRNKGDYASAEPLYKRALAIREKVLGPEHPNLALSLNLLALLYKSKGDYLSAEPLYKRALAIWEKALGLEHPNVAAGLNNLASLYRSMGNYESAEPLYKRALAIWEKVFSPEHPNVAAALSNLANLYKDKGEYASAEPLLKRAVAIYEKVHGLEHPNLAAAISNLATLYLVKGDHASAEMLFKRAVMIYEKALGPDHPNLAYQFNELALLYREQGNHLAELAVQQRAMIISDANLRQNLSAGSERQRLDYLAKFQEETNQAITLHAQFAPHDREALNLALSTLLSRKGRGLDTITESLAILRGRAAPQDLALLDQLVSARTRFSVLMLRGADERNRNDWRKQLQQLNEQAEKLESELNERSAEFRARTQPVTIERLREAIPHGSVLVEFIVYRPYDLKARKDGAPHYLVYMLQRQGEPRWADLGEARVIDQIINELRLALRDPQRADARQFARQLDQMVMHPIRKWIGGTKHLLVSPDGALNLVPFAALVDEQHEYLVNRYNFTYLTAGRDLLRLQIKQESKTEAMVLADPAFDSQPPAGALAQRDIKPVHGGPQSVPQIIDFASAKFELLPGTAGEARALKQLLPDARVLTREQATEAALKQTSRPRLLHIATHGFFLPYLKLNGGDLRNGEAVASTPMENPLLRSGLTLAGANQRKSGDNDGILTALEVAGLDLWGTKLVVLSACNTGVGDVRNGDGVYGLRRALVLAGSESQVMSLWKVSDQGTKELMVEYYKRLLGGEGRGEALRQVQLRMLKNPKRRHPFYWASFIQSGEWANLDGKR